MKLKLTCLLLLIGLSASPNRYCNGFRVTKAPPARVDDVDLIPTKYFFNHIQ